MINVLIVDDEPYIREGLKVLVDWKQEGYVIVGEAKNAYEAIEIIKEKNIDVAFIDIKMPKMNGIELATYIREKISQKIKVIFMTGFLDIEYVNSAFEVKAVQYLQKPIQPEGLLQLLRSMRLQIEIRCSEEKNRLKKLQNLKEYYLLDLIHGIKKIDTIRYMNQFFRKEHSIYYVQFNFYNTKKKSESENTPKDDPLLMIREEYYNQLNDRAFHLISHLTSYDAKVLGLIITESMLLESHITVYEYVDRMLKELEKYDTYKIVALIGKKVTEISQIDESYRDAIGSVPYQPRSQQIPLELRIMSFLEAHYMENITLKLLSEHFYINAAYLGQFFKKHYGVYLKDYINSLRVKKAVELLETTSLKIYQVAEYVGYQSADSLIAAFSKEMGVTPQKYRTIKRGE